ncbi:hypothetical protein L3X38_026400 [Prunus dulcis]|uniref:Uncharacterized protein n=1 Tax=Prunus dulcis TaxID=3755 RepID=A0AAD4VMG5_PRUDU|nr:hypothetical protein L3X38_026400 [Prunus dulcis]
MVIETTSVLVSQLLVFWVQHLLPLVSSVMAQVILLRHVLCSISFPVHMCPTLCTLHLLDYRLQDSRIPLLHLVPLIPLIFYMTLLGILVQKRLPHPSEWVTIPVSHFVPHPITLPYPTLPPATKASSPHVAPIRTYQGRPCPPPNLQSHFVPSSLRALEPTVDGYTSDSGSSIVVCHPMLTRHHAGTLHPRVRNDSII